MDTEAGHEPASSGSCDLPAAHCSTPLPAISPAPSQLCKSNSTKDAAHDRGKPLRRPRKVRRKPRGNAANPHRPAPCQLIKKLVQNVWDEAPEAAICQVDIQPAPSGEALLQIRVADDGPGFANLADS